MSLFNKMKVTKQRKTRVAKSGLSIAYNESFVLALEEAASLQNTYIVMELRETSSNKLGREGGRSLFFSFFYFILCNHYIMLLVKI